MTGEGRFMLSNLAAISIVNQWKGECDNATDSDSHRQTLLIKISRR